jgi:hypothetical protein
MNPATALIARTCVATPLRVATPWNSGSVEGAAELVVFGEDEEVMLTKEVGGLVGCETPEGQCQWSP